MGGERSEGEMCERGGEGEECEKRRGVLVVGLDFRKVLEEEREVLKLRVALSEKTAEDGECDGCGTAQVKGVQGTERARCRPRFVERLVGEQVR
jgi:hypothetical protein